MRATLAVATVLLCPTLVPGQSQDDLLNKAIAERNARAPAKADPAQAQALLTQADRLAEERKFDEAINLYERAYRMNPGDQNGYLRMLIAKRSAGRMSDADREALQLIESQRSLRVEEIIRSIRLNMVQAREALRSNDAELALSRVDAARAAMNSLPKDVDVSVYKHELDRMSGAARGKARRERPAAQEPVRLSDNPPPVSPQTANTQPGEPTQPQQPAARPMPSYEPVGGIVTVPANPMPDDPIFRFQRELETSIRNTRAIGYFGADASQLLTEKNVSYPEDWAERTANRTRYQDGEIFRGEVTRNAAGQDEYTAAYDIGDLVRPIPDFYGIDPDLGTYQNAQLDREWIRRRSMMFGGYAEDLAAGIPVLQFYGGMDNWATNPRTDPFELDRVLRTIDTFVGRPGMQQPPQPLPQPQAPGQ